MTAVNFIRLRGHHLLCLPRFRGLGYNTAFISGMREITQRLGSYRQLFVQLTIAPDDICAYCPHLDWDGCGLEGGEAEVASRDRQVLALLGLTPGSTAPYVSLQEALAAVSFSLSAICARCRWLDCCLNFADD